MVLISTHNPKLNRSKLNKKINLTLSQREELGKIYGFSCWDTSTLKKLFLDTPLLRIFKIKYFYKCENHKNLI